MPDSNLSTSIAAVKTKITTDAPTATVDEILSLARAAKSVGLSEDATVESAINSRVLTLSSGATTANMVKLSNAIKQMRDATAASSSSSVDLTAVSTNIIPDTDVTYDLGSSTHKFKDLYLDGNTLNLGNQTIKATATGIEVPELKIGTGTNTVKLTVASDGKLTTTETDSSGNTGSPAAAGGGGSSVTVSDTAPTSPSAGDQWFDSSSLTMFVYYADGSSSQWVPATPAGQTGATGATGSDGAAGSSVTSYANLASFPSSGNTAGDIGFDTDFQTAHMWDGVAWQRMSMGPQIGPRITTTPPATHNLNNDGSTATTITMVAVDESGFPITYDWDAYSGSTIYNSSSLPPQVTSVTESNGVFSLVGSSNSSNTGTFVFRSKASDGVLFTPAITTVSLLFDYLTGLVGHYDADDSNSYGGTGTSWADISGNNNTAMTLGSAVVYNSSGHGGKASFDWGGTNGVIGTTNSGSGTTGTVIAITRHNEVLSGTSSIYQSRLFYKSVDGTGSFLVMASNQGDLVHSTGYQMYMLDNSGSLTTSNTKLYVDKVDKTQVNRSVGRELLYETSAVRAKLHSIAITSVDFSTGFSLCSSNGSYSGTGEVRAIRIYDHALTQAQIAAVHDHYANIYGTDMAP